jgi:hypothetical protein
MRARQAFEKLRDALATVVAGSREIQVEEKEIGGVMRIRLTRPTPGGGFRYIRLDYLPDSDDPFDAYGALYGAYGNKDHSLNYDSRQWGPLEHVVSLAKEFVVDLKELADLPKPI